MLAALVDVKGRVMRSARRRRLVRWILAAIAALATPAWAWGPDGHRTVGAIADRLLVGTHAEARVRALLGGLTLRGAAVWADCAKGVDPSRGYAYADPGHYPECAPFETPSGEARLSDYVRRNDRNCERRPDEESCHKQYHYADIAIQRGRYAPAVTGARGDDVVGAIGAAIHVLRGEAAPAPFDIRSPREALMLLAHFVGDLHQPLHVGTVYLDPAGARVDPDPNRYDPATDTRGGNRIGVVVPHAKALGLNLHRLWDDVPNADRDVHIDAGWLAQARAVRRTPGDALTWPAAWAGGTLAQARLGYRGLAFGPRVDGQWNVTLPADYAARMDAIKKHQLTLAGARLAQLLRALWP
jgi:hypothetical protein